MRTYTHVILTLNTARRHPAFAAVGAALPDLPAIVGAALSGATTRQGLYSKVCNRRRFSVPDAALHSLPLLAAALAATWRYARGRSLWSAALAHALTDLATHRREDTRPPLWPFFAWRPGGLLYYTDPFFTVAEHALALVMVLRLRDKQPS